MFSTNCDFEKQMGAFQKPLQCQWSHIVAKKLNKNGNNHKFSLPHQAAYFWHLCDIKMLLQSDD